MIINDRDVTFRRQAFALWTGVHIEQLILPKRRGHWDDALLEKMSLWKCIRWWKIISPFTWIEFIFFSIVYGFGSILDNGFLALAKLLNMKTPVLREIGYFFKIITAIVGTIWYAVRMISVDLLNSIMSPRDSFINSRSFLPSERLKTVIKILLAILVMAAVIYSGLVILTVIPDFLVHFMSATAAKCVIGFAGYGSGMMTLAVIEKGSEWMRKMSQRFTEFFKSVEVPNDLKGVNVQDDLSRQTERTALIEGDDSKERIVAALSAPSPKAVEVLDEKSKRQELHPPLSDVDALLGYWNKYNSSAGYSFFSKDLDSKKEKFQRVINSEGIRESMALIDKSDGFYYGYKLSVCWLMHLDVLDKFDNGDACKRYLDMIADMPPNLVYPLSRIAPDIHFLLPLLQEKEPKDIEFIRNENIIEEQQKGFDRVAENHDPNLEEAMRRSEIDR